MRVLGIDLSTHAIDCVLIPYDHVGDPVWLRFTLAGADAFDRARNVAETMPSASFYDDIIAVGIEDPRGHNAGAIYRVQGAVLAKLPKTVLVRPWIPSAWRKAVGLPGNASKGAVMVRSVDLLSDIWSVWPQDAHDAHLIALATRDAIETKAAA